MPVYVDIPTEYGKTWLKDLVTGNASICLELDQELKTVDEWITWLERICQKTQALGSGMSTARFLLSPHVILYFIGIVIPVVAGGYFLAYLYPLLGENLGISETNIGYSYLLNGVCIICLGGFLTKQLTRRLGQKGSLALARYSMRGLFDLRSLAGNPRLCGTSGPFRSFRQLWTSGAVYVLYRYEGSTGVWVRQSDGGYSLFENMSQVFGSFIFGIIYVNGVTVGLTIAGGVIFAAAVLFFLFGEKVDAGEESNA